DKTKLVQNITGDVINQINTTTSNPVTNIEGKFKVSDGTSANTKTLTISKSGVPEIQFKGETNKIAVEVAGTDSVPVVTVKADPNLGQNIDISNNTSITNLSAGFNVKAGANTGAIQAGNTLEFAGKNYVEAEYDSTAKKMTIGLDDATKNKIDNLSTTINNASKWTIKDGETPAGEKEINSTTPLVVEGDAYVKTKVDNSGLHLSMDETKLNSTITNNTTVNQHGDDITALKGGFTVSNAAGAKQDITLGGATKKNIKFEGEADKIDVAVAADGTDGAKVTVTANANLGQNIDISNNSAITNLDNRVTTNAGNITNNTNNITKLQGGFDLKAGTATSNVALGGATAPTVEFATADDTMTVGLTGTKVTYGIDKTKLVQNITGDVINQINNTTTNPVTNISAKFGVTAETGTKKTVTLAKDTEPTVKFEGDGTYIKSAMTADGVKYNLDTTALNNAITNNTTVQNLAGGFNVKAGSVQGAITAGDTLEFAGKNYVETIYDSAAKKMTIGLDDATKNKIDNLSTTINNASKWTIKDGETPAGEKEINSTTPLVVEGDAYVKTKVDNSGLHLSMDETKLNSTITNNTTVNQHGDDITALKGGFTVSNAAGAKQDITLGGATKKNIKFEGEADKIDVAVAADGTDGAKVTVTANANLGQNIDISNNSAITNLDNRVTTNTSNITKLQGGFDLADAGGVKSSVALGGTAKEAVTFKAGGTIGDAFTASVDGNRNVTYAIDKTKLVQNITGDVINQINNTTSNPVTNISAKFGVTAETGTKKTVTLAKDTEPTVKFEGDGTYIKSAMTTDGVKYNLDTTALNNAITNNTTVQNLAGGFNVKAGSVQGAITAGDTLEFAGKNYVEAEYDSTAKKMTIGLDDATKNKIDNISTTIGAAAKWTIQDAETPAGAKVIDASTPLTVTGADGVTTKVDASGLKIGLDGTTLGNTINNSSTVINNVEAKFKIADAGTGTKTITANKTGTETIKFEGDGSLIESEVGASGVKYKVNATNLTNTINTTINNNTTVNQHGDDITALKGGFTVSNAAGAKQDITLGGATKKNIKFEGEADKIDVAVAADGTDGAKVTVTANANLGTHIDISSNTTVTNLINIGLKFDANVGGVQTNKLGSTVKIQGAGTEADDKYSGENVKTKIAQDTAGNTTIDILLNKDLKAASVTVGKDGKDGKIGVTGANGKDGVTIWSEGPAGQNGVDGHIGLTGKDGASADIHVKDGAPGLDGTTLTRIVYEDKNGTTHEVATLDDG
ncbi:beta strand repeat-containing protein, partial [Pyramidobacter sp. C12-8]|uniref:beta strand repeat-containing protein n=1 Tax=Pyramidobacter sp. C12-8 TaxID=1943580 RepID=UPI0009D0CA59